ncbi:MAG: transcription antitermination factor NusB [Clostridium sp.]|nr:transcription antitermination factor NusB [Clostridium sp.]
MRKRTREIAMELLYQSTMNKKSAEELMDDYFEDNQDDLMEDTDMEYLTDVLEGVLKNKEALDTFIEKYLVKWKLSRISKINLSILRLGTYELLYKKDIPQKVSISEAVEIAKKFSDETSGAFINGVLDKISKTEEEISTEDLVSKENLETEAEVVNQDKESIETADELTDMDSSL